MLLLGTIQKSVRDFEIPKIFGHEYFQECPTPRIEPSIFLTIYLAKGLKSYDLRVWNAFLFPRWPQNRL